MGQNLKQFSVLYAEDELSLQEVMVEYLNITFKQVYTAVDGEDALLLYKRHNPDVLIFDINMPKLDGLSAARLIRESNKKIPIIMFSAYNDIDKLHQSIDINVLSYTLKPINPFEFQKVLKKLGETLISNFFHITHMCIWDINLEKLFNDGVEIHLTEKERLLLKLFIKHHRYCIEYTDIMANVWIDNLEDEISIDSVKKLVQALRNKLPKNIIKNVYARGYILN